MHSTTMADCEVQPFTRLRKGQVCPIVIVVGDPSRVEMIANLADSSSFLAFNKEYKSYDCEVKGVHFTAISHGVGNSGAAICFQELIKCGAKCIIRAGTSGYLQKGMKQGEIFIAYGAIREEGVTPKIVGTEFPAVPTPEVFDALVESTKSLGYTYHTGLCLTSEVFYTPPEVAAQMKKYSEAGISSVSMEESTLFIIGSLNKVWTGVVQVFDGSPFTWINNDYDPHGDTLTNAKKNMLKVCFNAIPNLNRHFQNYF